MRLVGCVHHQCLVTVHVIHNASELCMSQTDLELLVVFDARQGSPLASDVARCDDCLAYINPYCTFSSTSESYVSNDQSESERGRWLSICTESLWTMHSIWECSVCHHRNMFDPKTQARYRDADARSMMQEFSSQTVEYRVDSQPTHYQQQYDAIDDESVSSSIDLAEVPAFVALVDVSTIAEGMLASSPSTQDGHHHHETNHDTNHDGIGGVEYLQSVKNALSAALEGVQYQQRQQRQQQLTIQSMVATTNSSTELSSVWYRYVLASRWHLQPVDLSTTRLSHPTWTNRRRTVGR
jgi:hypothetical protein